MWCVTIAHALFTAIFDIIFHLNNANTVPNAIKSHFGFMIHNLLSKAHEAYLNCTWFGLLKYRALQMWKIIAESNVLNGIINTHI